MNAVDPSPDIPYPDLISDRKSTRLNSSHTVISYAVFCLKKKNHHPELHSNSVLLADLLFERQTQRLDTTAARFRAHASILDLDCRVAFCSSELATAPRR